MKDKLDSEGLGIILVKNFLETFFSRDADEQEECKLFYLYHYNGIKRSNSDNEVWLTTSLFHLSPSPLTVDCLVSYLYADPVS